MSLSEKITFFPLKMTWHIFIYDRQFFQLNIWGIIFQVVPAQKTKSSDRAQSLTVGVLSDGIHYQKRMFSF